MSIPRGMDIQFFSFIGLQAKKKLNVHSTSPSPPTEMNGS